MGPVDVSIFHYNKSAKGPLSFDTCELVKSFWHPLYWKLPVLVPSLWHISQFVTHFLWTGKVPVLRVFPIPPTDLSESFEESKRFYYVKFFSPDLWIPIFRPPLPPCPAPVTWTWYLVLILSLVQYGEQPLAICVAQTQINNMDSIAFSWELKKWLGEWLTKLLWYPVGQKRRFHAILFSEIKSSPYHWWSRRVFVIQWLKVNFCFCFWLFYEFLHKFCAHIY